MIKQYMNILSNERWRISESERKQARQLRKEGRKDRIPVINEAHSKVEKEREEVDAYIDSRLATLEVILNKTLEAVNRGRERLAGASDKDVLSQLAE